MEENDLSEEDLKQLENELEVRLSKVAVVIK